MNVMTKLEIEGRKGCMLKKKERKEVETRKRKKRKKRRKVVVKRDRNCGRKQKAMTLNPLRERGREEVSGWTMKIVGLVGKKHVIVMR